ncbi:hypothetical protein GGI20_003091 [Coemansia sp. BCRC 34301]|nr:hypothetical protein GGI20_003091 [Coemansia sp. BCRC 34301]
MAQESARSPSAPETPLSVSFRDSAFMNFVNDIHASNDHTLHQGIAGQRRPEGSTSRHGAYSSSKEDGSRKTYETPPRQLRTARHDGTPGSVEKTPLVLPASLALSNNHATLGTSGDDDGDWEGLDDIELNSQVMRQLMETEESFYATQEQCLESPSMLLSQEFAEARIEDSLRRDGAGGARAAKGARTMSAPGPAITRSAPETPAASGQPTFVSSAGTLATTGQQQNQDTVHPHRINAAIRGKVNLYPRLAQHIPPTRPDSRSALQRQRQSGQHGKPMAADQDSVVSRQQQQPQRPKPIGTGSSTLASALRRQPQAHTFVQGSVPEAAGTLDELTRLRAENERMRAETEQLRAQLYTKEGEVIIVRENLTRTEMDNTHLQEQLTSQITGAMARLQQSEKEHLAEIERLRTELVFTQHEAKADAMAKAQTARAATTPRPVAAASRSGPDVRGVGVGGTQVSGTNSPITYPSVEDFMSVPKALPRSAVPTTPTMTPSSAHPLSAVSRFSEKSARSGDSSATHTEASMTALLDILSGIAELPNAASFGALVSLSAQLSRAVRDLEPKQLGAFHSMACDTLASSASTSGGFELLGATAQLILQAIGALSEFRAAWLFGVSEPSSLQSPLSSTSAQASGLRCTSQLAAAAGAALLESISAAAKMRARSAGSVVCSAAIASLCQLLTRLIGMQPGAALESKLWAEFNPCELGQHLTLGLGLDGLLGVVGLLTTLIQVSPATWEFLRGNSGDFEQLLLAIMRRLQAAFLASDALMLDSKRAFLVLIASAIVMHEDDTPTLINSMQRFTMGMVQWFLEEHLSLTRPARPADCERRVQVFFEYIKCLNVVLSEVRDVVALLGGDNSPLFYGFVATCTRMTLGESAFDGVASIRELAADLLAYAVTEDQAISIQNL